MRINLCPPLPSPPSFSHSLNPNSGDTGGILLDDWSTLHVDKLRILHTLQPAPTHLREVEKEKKGGKRGKEDEGAIVMQYEYQLGVETKATATLSSSTPAASAKKPKGCFGFF
jgi:hypothetical protein